MRWLLAFFVGFCWLLPALANKADDAALPASLQLELRAQFWANNAVVRLSDVLSLKDGAAKDALNEAKNGTSPPAWLNMEIAPAPQIGYVERWSRAQLESLIKRRLLRDTQRELQIVWNGAPSVAVQSQTQTISAQRLGEVALQWAQQELAPKYADVQVALAGNVSALEVPSGEYQIKPRAIAAQANASRLPVWLDILIAGNVVRSAVVSVNVSAWQQVYVARRAVAAGDALSWSDFAVRRENVFALGGVAATVSVNPAEKADPVLQANWRASVALREGQILLQNMLPAMGMIWRGDRVRVVARDGAVQIESSGIALRDASVGQRLEVRLLNNNELVTGYLMLDSRVLLQR